MLLKALLCKEVGNKQSFGTDSGSKESTPNYKGFWDKNWKIHI